MATAHGVQEIRAEREREREREGVRRAAGGEDDVGLMSSKRPARSIDRALW
jgi:hypothetical protein